MKRILFLCIFLFMLFSASFVSADICQRDEVLDGLRKALYVYYIDPSESNFTESELKSLLTFYVGIGSDRVTAECTSEQKNKVDQAKVLPDAAPSCGDGTKYGKCSSTKPMYCYAGSLVQRCRLCGCPEGQMCDITYVYTEKGNKGQWGKCNPGNVACSINSDCGINTYIGDYYCENGDVYRERLTHFCVGDDVVIDDALEVGDELVVGEGAPYCYNSTPSVLIDDCTGNEYCVVGLASCQTNITNQSQTTFSGIVTIKGRLIDYFTKQPITNATVFTWDTQTTRRDVYSNSNGEFTITADTTTVTQTTPKSFGINPACYNNMGFAIFRNSNNSLYVNVQINSLIGPAKSFQVTSSEVNLGDIQMWPAVDIAINSDIPVQFKIEYSGITGSGNVNYKTAHYLSYSFLLNVDARVKLSDSASNIYYSPYTNLPLSHGCTPVILNFSNNQFNWVGFTQTT